MVKQAPNKEMGFVPPISCFVSPKWQQRGIYWTTWKRENEHDWARRKSWNPPGDPNPPKNAQTPWWDIQEGQAEPLEVIPPPWAVGTFKGGPQESEIPQGDQKKKGISSLETEQGHHPSIIHALCSILKSCSMENFSRNKTRGTNLRRWGLKSSRWISIRIVPAPDIPASLFWLRNKQVKCWLLKTLTFWAIQKKKFRSSSEQLQNQLWSLQMSQLQGQLRGNNPEE